MSKFPHPLIPLFALDEGESQAVGKPIGLLVDSEGDIPAIAEYAKALKAGGGASPAPAAAAAAADAVLESTAAAAAGSVGEEGVVEKCMLFVGVHYFSAPWYVMGGNNSSGMVSAFGSLS